MDRLNVPFGGYIDTPYMLTTIGTDKIRTWIYKNGKEEIKVVYLQSVDQFKIHPQSTDQLSEEQENQLLNIFKNNKGKLIPEL